MEAAGAAARDAGSRPARVYERSIADLASLRLKGIEGIGELPAAGMPWFMTVFGRDTLITSLQTLVFGPELAIGALRSLAALQADQDDPAIDAEPGKILHELRRGKAATSWFPIYYGSIDCHAALPRAALRGLALDGRRRDREGARAGRARRTRVDRRVRRPGRRRVPGVRAARATRASRTSAGRTPGTRSASPTGRLAEPPIAPREVQGYAYNARIRAAELADRVWDDPDLAIRLRGECRRPARRRGSDRGLLARGPGTFALALDGDKQQVDSLCSNLGHLLWSGIVTPTGSTRRRLCPRRPGAVDRLGRPHDGRGARPPTTRSATTTAPCGRTTRQSLPGGSARRLHRSRPAVQPQPDRGGRFPRLLLPEVFAGYERVKTAFPVAYPTAARPQAWAAGAPVLCLTLLLGLRPDPTAGVLATSTLRAPNWLEGTRLEGIRAVGRVWSVEVRNGTIVVDEM